MIRKPSAPPRDLAPVVTLATARTLFHATAALSLLGALLHAWLPLSTPPLRETLIGACVACAIACAVVSLRLRAAQVARAVHALGWVIVAMAGLLAAATGDGVRSISLGYVVVAICMVALMVGRRPAFVLSGAGIALAGALAAAQAGEWLPPAASIAPRPLSMQLFGIVVLFAAGTGVACVVAHVVGRHAREAYRRGERFVSLMRIAADWYWEFDAQLRFTALPQGFAGDTRWSGIDLAGRHPWELPLGLSDDEIDALRADLEARRPFHDLIVRHAADAGAMRHFSMSGEPRFDHRGVFLGYWGVGRDVSDEVRLRQAREASETRYRELFDRSPTGLVLHRSGRVLDANAAALQLFGYANVAAMRGRLVFDHYDDPASRALAFARLQQIESMPVGRSLPSTHFRLRACDGRRSSVAATAVRVAAAGGLAVLSIYSDETERIAAEDAWRRSQALLGQVLATSPDLIVLTEIDSGRFVMVNPSFTRVLGFEAAEVVGRTAAEVGAWHSPQDRMKLVEAIRRNGGVQNLALRFVAKSGQIVPMLVSAAGFELEGRGYLVISARDVSETERTRLEREAMFANASVGIAFTRDRRFVQANPRFERMFGRPIGSLTGQPESVIWSSAQEYEEIGRTYGPLLAEGQAVEFERPRQGPGQSPTWYRVLAKAVDPSQPYAGGTVWICEDVTERKRVGEALEQARDAAEAASRAKSAFLANTSHELRTPLNGLLGLARLAQQPNLDEQRRQRYIDQIAESSQMLSDIMADILDLSKIEAGKLTLEAVPFDLRATVTKLHQAYEELAQARGLELKLAIAADAPSMVLGDPIRVRQILSNFVNNALKFTTVGGVLIELERAHPQGARLAVRDSGPGIDAATRERLFSPFTQADSSTTRRFGGTGLGLSICRELAQLMGGSVGVDSEPDRGSVFWAELPLPDTAEEDPVTGFGALDAQPLAGAHVLVVEDNPVNMLICVALLEQQGVRVVQAANGREAIDAVERALLAGDPFDAVLMDVQMPVMSGNEAATRLRERHDAATLPIVALTAAALVSEREQALRAGMNDFLTKPIEPKRLLRALARVIADRP